jgi:hypothetical protein
VRFRHTDTDIVREARQQDFIRWAKAQYPISKLFSNRDRLLRIFGKHSTLDKNLQSSDQIINLFNLVLNADGSAIKQIPFPANLQPCTATSCFVTAERSREAQVYASFMRATPQTKAKKKTSTPKSAKGHKKLTEINTAGLTDALSDGHSQVAALAKVKMPIYFPRYIKTGSEYCLSLIGNCTQGDEPAAEYVHSYPRNYLLRDQSGHAHEAYRMTIDLNSLKGQYYGVQGIAWRNPPLLRSPSGTRTINGRKLLLYADGGKLTTVAWHQSGNSYWISNTLTTDIPNGQMVNMAASMMRAKR